MFWPTQRTVLGEFERLNRDMDRLFTSLTRANGSNSFPAMNIWMQDEQLVVSAELPGLSADDIDISIEGDTLTVSGERERPALADGEQLLRHEREFGAFSRAFHLPYRVDVDNVSAAFHHGVLTIELPRAEADKPRKIEIAVK